MSPSVSVRLLSTQSDTRLVELARAGHERAFEALVQRYRRALLGYCRRRLLLPNERAEDALQQGLLQAWLALREGTEVRDVKPWLYRIVHNAALNTLRGSGYNYAELSETLSGTNAPSEDLDRRIAVREALAGLAVLPEKQREALLRTAVDGCSYREAATMLGLSEPALRGLVYRARATLRTAITALTPTPLLSWTLSSGGADAPLAGRLLEVGGGGSAGLASVLLKTGAAALTTGALVGAVHTLHHAPAARGPTRFTPVASPTQSAAAGTEAPTAVPVRADAGAASRPQWPAHRVLAFRVSHQARLHRAIRTPSAERSPRLDLAQTRQPQAARPRIRGATAPLDLGEPVTRTGSGGADNGEGTRGIGGAREEQGGNSDAASTGGSSEQGSPGADTGQRQSARDGQGTSGTGDGSASSGTGGPGDHEGSGSRDGEASGQRQRASGEEGQSQRPRDVSNGGERDFPEGGGGAPSSAGGQEETPVSGEASGSGAGGGG